MYNTNNDAFTTKVETDLKLFTELFKSYITESELPEFKKLLNSAYGSCKELLQETNVSPLSSVVSLRKKKVLDTITENEITARIYGSFRKELSKGFVTPLEDGSIESVYESEMGNIFKIVVKSSADLDPEISKKYAIFEKVVRDTISNIVLPKDNVHKMNEFATKLDPSYFEVFDRTLKDIKCDFNRDIDALAKNIAIRMFKKGIQFGSDYNKDDYELDKYKGLSSLFKDTDALDDTLAKVPEKIKVPFTDDEDLSINDEDDLPESVKEEIESNDLESADIDSIVNK